MNIGRRNTKELLLIITVIVIRTNSKGAEDFNTIMLDDNSNSRIWDGTKATDRSKFAYQVYLNFECHPNDRKKGDCGGFCGGSLITPQYVLTAAHCCVNHSSVQVRFGLLARHEQGVNIISVTASQEDMIIHDGYSESLVQNDICLIRLRNPVRMNANISTINLPTYSELNHDQYRGQQVIVAGWGEGRLSDPLGDYLKFTQNTVISLARCNQVYNVSNYQICTMEDFSGSCRGDSGGPLVINHGVMPVVIGLVSYGNIPCENKSPAVYTFVAAYLDWIKKHTGLTSHKNIPFIP